jgi:hypothetical protein
MPEISKRKAGGPTNGTPAKAGSVLASAVDVADIQDDYIKMLLYGQNRVGKTTLACQFPKPLLLISFEPAKSGGARSVKRVPGIRYVKVESTVGADQLAGELRGADFATHVLDGAGHLERMHMADVLGLTEQEMSEQLGRAAHGGISRDQYTDRTERTKNQLKKFLNLQAHTVIICREKDHSPPRDQYQPRILRTVQVESFVASDLSGGTVGWLHDTCDFVCRLYVEKEVVTKTEKVRNAKGKLVERQYDEETGRQVRRLRTMLHPNYAAGFRSERPAEIPEFVQADTPEEMYNKMMALIRGG